MRLIDADELKKDDEVTMWLSNDAIRTGKQLKMFSEYFINKIDNMPTVQAVPIEVIDKIRAEIEQNAYPIVHGVNNHEKGMTLYGILQVIDKYRTESDHKCHNCKHYTSGEYDGSCDSYICEHYSGWEARDKG